MITKQTLLTALSRFLSDCVNLFVKKSEVPWEKGDGTSSARLKGSQSHPYGTYSVAEGYGTLVSSSAPYGHAEGNGSFVDGEAGHAEGGSTASGVKSHAEGSSTFANGDNSHAEGSGTIADGATSHAEGVSNTTMNEGEHAEGKYNITIQNKTIHTVGVGNKTNNVITRKNGHLIDVDGKHYIPGIGGYTGTENSLTGISDLATVVNGIPVEKGTGTNSVKQKGSGASASGNYSFAENKGTATANYSHAEGGSTANGAQSHAEGNGCTAESNNSHAEGYQNSVSGAAAHGEGRNNTTNNEAEHAEGKYNVSISGSTIHTVGIGTSSQRKNAHLITNDGKHYIPGIGGYTGTETWLWPVKDLAYVINNAVLGQRKSVDFHGNQDDDYVLRIGYPSADSYTYLLSLANINSHTPSNIYIVNGYGNIVSINENLYYDTHFYSYYYYDSEDDMEYEYLLISVDTDETITATFTVLDLDTNTNAIPRLPNTIECFLEDLPDGGAAKVDITSQIIHYDAELLTETTWSELKSLRDNSGLTPGQQYRITDYNTTTVQSNTQSAGHVFDIIVIADSVNTLNENARAILHSGDTYFSTAGAKLEAWQLKYCLDNDTTRFAWADSTNGKGVIYWMKDEWDNECPYDFKNIQFARWEQTNPVGYVFDEDEWDYVEDSDQSWVSNYDLKAGFYSINGDSNDVMLFYDENLGDYKKKIPYTVSSTPTYCYTFGRGLDASLGKKVYDNVIKEYYNSNKLQLNNIVFLQTTLAQNCYSNTFESNCYSNTFESNCCSNTFGNECYSNTFSDYFYYNTFGNRCNYNTFGNSCSTNTFGSDCTHNTFRAGCYSNTFGDNCYSNAFGNECYSNTFGNECYSNTFGDYCSNTFGNNCNSNTFGDDVISNTFGNNCNSNTFGASCSSTIFGDNCYSNSFGNNCYNNTFGNNCHNNTFGNSCNNNTFGNDCKFNKFGNSSSTKSYYRYIIIEDGNQRIRLYCSSTTSSNNFYQNAKIAQGVNNSGSWKDITDSNVGQTYQTVYQPVNSQIISV